ncbi:MAG TPA: Ig-like domain-containing protein, partial [Caldilineaceae bacterium]|nr:Ig-like domain-containing protein [Caldilineaceae bacterium]
MKTRAVAALLGALFAVALLLGIHSAAQAQAGGPTVTFTAIPKDLQLYPRDLSTNRAVVPIAGSVDSPDQDEIIVRIYREDVLHETLSQPLTYEGASAPFSFAPEITAELANYDFQIIVRDGETESLIKEVEFVVAGDVYLINGQSNAFANKGAGSTSANGNQHEFLRSFGRRDYDVTLLTADTQWHLAEGDGWWGPGYVGQWGLRLGRLLLDTYQVPVAILNGAHGGKGISWFTRNDADPDDLNTNYGRLLWRAQEAGVTQGVRAVFWYQGEADGGRPATHENGVMALVEDWHTDFPALEKVYIFQIRKSTCTVQDFNLIIDLMDRQRRLDSLESVEVMSTTGVDGHDGCHYYYTDGFELLAQHIFGIVRRDLYGEADLQNVDAPHISSAFLRTPTEIVLVMRDPDDTLLFEEGAGADFVVQGPPVTVTVTSGIVEGNKIRLLLSGDASQATHISYIGHSFAGPWVTNANGVGMLAFRVPLSTAPDEPPTVSITRPSNGATFTQGDDIVIQAEANDLDGTVVQVEFYSNASSLGTATAAPWQISWPDAPVGSHTITAVATDSDGDTATSAPINIVVNAQTGNSAPSVNIASPASGDTFLAGESIPIQANASDSDGSVSKVQFLADGQLLGEDHAAPYQFVWNNASAGDHSLTAVAADNQGATAASAPVNIHVVEEVPGSVRLGLEPSISHVLPGQRFSVTVAVRATDQQLDGVAAYLNFDPAAAQVVEVLMGNTLPTVLQNQHDNNAGTIDLAAGIALSSQDYATGNFALATLIFEAADAPTVAESALTFSTTAPRKSDATFNGASLLSDTRNGSILFEVAGVSGSVLLEREAGVQDPPHPSWQVPLTVKLFRANEVTAAGVDAESTPAYVFTPTTDEMGAFHLAGIAPGVYVAAIKNSHTLQTVQTVDVAAGDNSVIFETLREGDADNNNFVGLVDFSVVASAFGQCAGAAAFDPRADFTQDGCVNLTDFSLLSGNYSQAGDMAPGDSASSSGAPPQNGAVTLALAPSGSALHIGQSFDVAIQVQAGDQAIDVAGVFLNYDPAVLRLDSVTPGTALDTVLRNIFDNTAGTFNY